MVHLHLHTVISIHDILTVRLGFGSGLLHKHSIMHKPCIMFLYNMHLHLNESLSTVHLLRTCFYILLIFIKIHTWIYMSSVVTLHL